METIGWLLIIAGVCYLRRERGVFRFWCSRHDGEFTSRFAYPDDCTVCSGNDERYT